MFHKNTFNIVKRQLSSNPTYYGNKGKIAASFPYFQSVDPEESPAKYQQHWGDMSIIKNNGRAFDADVVLLDKNNTFSFPRLKAKNLNGKDILVPDSYNQKPIKFVKFALNAYGEKAAKTWTEPFVNEYGYNHKKIEIIEICFLEWKWLSIFTNSIISSLKSNTIKNVKDIVLKQNVSMDQILNNVCVSVGTIMEFAKAARLPNKYTGYVCLLDGDNRVRWRGCGQMMTGGASNDKNNRYDEFALLKKCTDELLKEY